MNKRRFSVVTAATAAWALVSWLMLSSGTLPRDAAERPTSPTAEQLDTKSPGAAPDGHYVGAALRPTPEAAPPAEEPGLRGLRIKARHVNTSIHTPFDHAMAHYEAGRYAQAFELYAHLADCGHRESARIAMQMRRFGPQLYGMDFAASVSQIARWAEVLASAIELAPERCAAS